MTKHEKWYAVRSTQATVEYLDQILEDMYYKVVHEQDENIPNDTYERLQELGVTLQHLAVTLSKVVEM